MFLLLDWGHANRLLAASKLADSTMHVLEAYLNRLHEIRNTGRGTPELSYRAALENLLNAVGGSLDPVLQATAELADSGAGRPDFGVFESRSGNFRAAVEVKPVEEDTPQTADGRQVARYWKHYGCVLVTNYRDFLLVIKEPEAKTPTVVGRYQLAADEDAFWRARPRTLAKEHGEGLLDFLAGAMTRTAPIARPGDLAADLARHAREAKRRLAAHDMSALQPLEEAMEQALGLHFQGNEGAAFFRSSLVQTLFYGLFSGWMLWRQSRRGGERFDWKGACEYLALPLIGDLYEEIARPRRLADLDLREPLEWATASLNRVVEDEFFQRFDSDHAITLFYEPFLQAFDPDLRKELGVWYTPPEIVQYMVGRVDQLLRRELGVADGLADENVFVLDPAAGTGSYLVEVARRIHQTLSEQGQGSLAAARVKRALRTRIFGFEILPAPYVVAHLQLGVFLRSLGANLSSRERFEVYLTNALTGWDPPKEPKTTLLFPELQEEAERASTVKRNKPILVVLGNPPYNGFAGVALEEQKDLLQPYFDGLEAYDVQVRGLNDLYVRFYRLAERRIADVGKRGIVCFISNFSWLDGQSHPVMRKRFLDAFDEIWIDNCNGDKYRTGKRTPDGRSDQSMFTTDTQPIGIQVGTAIATMVKTGRDNDGELAVVRYRDLWGLGNDKRAELVDSLSAPNIGTKFANIVPSQNLRFILVPYRESAGYAAWPRLVDVFVDCHPGIQTSRDELLVDVDREALVARMKRYFSPNIPDEAIAEDCPCAMREGNRFAARLTRAELVRRGMLDNNIVRFSYRPLDERWLYWDPYGKLLDEKRVDYFPQVWEGNIGLTAAAAIRKGAVEGPLPVINFGCRHLIERGANIFTLLHRPQASLHGSAVESNIRAEIIKSLCAAQGIPPFQADNHAYTPAAMQAAEDLFFHLITILWSPAYRAENEAALRQDWPRVPIPADGELLAASATLGRAVADLLLPDKPVRGVTCGTIRAELRPLGLPCKVGGGAIDPDADLKVEATWGFFGAKNAVMCGKGRTAPAAADPASALDVFINDKVYWSGVPLDVWTMTIGGYPVIKKWLSYREHRVLGRPLRLEEMTYITEVIRRLKALLLLGDALDANYRAAANHAMDGESWKG
jgi:hypothetical protein